MTTTVCKSAAVKNNSGTVLYGGNVASDSPITTNVTHSTNCIGEPRGTRVADPDTDGQIASGNGTHVLSGTYKPFSSGKFAYQVGGKYVIMGDSDTLSGASKTTLVSCAGDFSRRRAVNSIDHDRVSLYTDFSYVSGVPTSKAVGDYALVGASKTQGDDAARPTRAVPGEFVYMVTGKTPTQADYSAKTC